jgi:hypothetical protein
MYSMVKKSIAYFVKSIPRFGAIVIGFVAIVVPALSTADLVIHLQDGQRILVPVDNSQIKKIEFAATESAVQQDRAARDTIKAPAVVEPSGPRVLRVGENHKFKFPSDAARAAKDGDTIEIDAGTYHNDYATWKQNDITIRGVGGMAHLKSKGLIPNKKAIWIINGNNVLIENIEFSGASVRDTNGAGIRHQGGNLTLRNTFFHHNEFSILSGRLPDAVIEIESSRFWFQQRERRFSHGVYIGTARRLVFVGNHVKGTSQGHQVKSRAMENHILYNRIEDVPGGDSSRLIDLSNCGLTFIIGNDLHQAATSENLNAIGYGPEGCRKLTEKQMRLYVVNNTFVNEATNGVLVNNHAGGDVVIANNLLFGKGEFLVGRGRVEHNVIVPLRKRIGSTWSAPSGSDAIDNAVKLSPVGGVSLLPTKEFLSPVGTHERPRVGDLDIGSRESAR